MEMNSDELHLVLVCGAGWTGQQIACQIAAHGKVAVLYDTDSSACDRARSWCEQKSHQLVMDGIWNANQLEGLSNRIRSVAQLSNLDSIDLIIECVPEQISLKKRTLRALAAAAPERCLLVSNSSYFVPSLLKPFVSNPKRFAHLHFHVPVWHSTIVDIATCDETSESTTKKLFAFAEAIGQTPIVQNVENPGYLFNWLLQSVLQSALELNDRGVATPEDIDLAWTTVTKMPLGPFGIMDQIGLDVIEHVLSNGRWLASDQTQIDRLDRFIEFIRIKTAKGHLGVKSGQGFLDYDENQSDKA